MSIASIGPGKKEETMNTGTTPAIADLVGKAAIAIAAAASVLVIAGCNEGIPAIVSQAMAAPMETEAAYFPIQLPSPEGPPAPVIQGF
jgi:hypothetical protein